MADEKKAVELVSWTVNLFGDFTGERQETEKRWGDGLNKFTLLMPVPSVDWTEEVDEQCKRFFGMSAQDVWKKGIRQVGYDERAFDKITKDDKGKKLPPEELAEVVPNAFGGIEDTDAFTAQAVSFFEKAVSAPPQPKEKSTKARKVSAFDRMCLDFGVDPAVPDADARLKEAIAAYATKKAAKNGKKK